MVRLSSGVILAGGSCRPDQRNEQTSGARQQDKDTRQYHHHQNADCQPDRDGFIASEEHHQGHYNMAKNKRRRPGRAIIGADCRVILATNIAVLNKRQISGEQGTIPALRATAAKSTHQRDKAFTSRLPPLPDLVEMGIMAV